MNTHCKNSYSFCEACCKQAVFPNGFVEAVDEYSYVARQALVILFHKIVAAVTARIRRAAKTDRHDHSNGLCQRCVSRFVVCDNSFIESAKEFFYICGRICMMVAFGLGMLAMGVTMFFVALFPSTFRGKSRHEVLKEREWHETRRRQWEQGRRQEDEARRKEDEEYWAAYRRRHEEDRARANAIAAEGIIDVHSNLLEDDQRVAEVNSTIKAVEQGSEDPGKLQKMREELVAFREETWKKDQARMQKLNAMKDKAHEADRLYKQAMDCEKRTEYEQAERLYRQADSLTREADCLYKEFLSI